MIGSQLFPVLLLVHRTVKGLSNVIGHKIASQGVEFVYYPSDDVGIDHDRDQEEVPEGFMGISILGWSSTSPELVLVSLWLS